MSIEERSEPELGTWSILVLRVGALGVVLVLGWFLLDAIRG